MPKNDKIVCHLEQVIASSFKSLAQKKGVSASVLLRSMIIDELRMQGMMPEDHVVELFKGA